MNSATTQETESVKDSETPISGNLTNGTNTNINEEVKVAHKNLDTAQATEAPNDSEALLSGSFTNETSDIGNNEVDNEGPKVVHKNVATIQATEVPMDSEAVPSGSLTNKTSDVVNNEEEEVAPKRKKQNPNPSRCLGVFGLSVYTQERELRDMFGKYGPIENVKVIYDTQSGRSRGFAFVYFEETRHAEWARERLDGQVLGGRKLRVDFSKTECAHSPTPGVYKGKPSLKAYSGPIHLQRSGSSHGRALLPTPSPYNRPHYSR